MLTKIINKNIERELIAKCEDNVRGSMRIVKADRTPRSKKREKRVSKESS